MKLIFLLVFLGTLLDAGAAGAGAQPDCTAYNSPAPRAICIKRQHDGLLKINPQARQWGSELIVEGDMAFKNKDYNKAYKAYDQASVNFPNAYALLRTGDAIFMGLATETVFRDENATPTGACLVPQEFVRAVDGVIENNYQTGIALAKILKAGPPVHPTTLAEVARKSACMHALAAQYRTAKSGCVSLALVQACVLGATHRPQPN